MPGVPSSMPFIASVLDTLEPGGVSVAQGCAILTTAIAPEIGIGTPPGAARHVSRLFHRLLTGLQTHAETRSAVETRLKQIFALAAARDFEALAAM